MEQGLVSSTAGYPYMLNIMGGYRNVDKLRSKTSEAETCRVRWVGVWGLVLCVVFC